MAGRPGGEVQKWALDPLFSTFRHLLVATIHNDVRIIDRDERYEFYLCERPIRKVYLLGTIIEYKLKSTRENTVKAVFKLDDGTGVIECWRYYNDDSTASIDRPHLGDYVAANGVLHLLNGIFIVQMSAVERCEDVNVESLHNIETIHLFRTVYDKPFDNSDLAVNKKSNVGASDICSYDFFDPDSYVKCAKPFPPFKCSCLLSFPAEYQEELLSVQKNFIYCACFSSFHPQDPTGFIQMYLLHLLFSFCSSERSNQQGGSAFSLNRASSSLSDEHLVSPNLAPETALLHRLLNDNDILLNFAKIRHEGDKIQFKQVYGEFEVETYHPLSKSTKDLQNFTPHDLLNTQTLITSLLESLHSDGVIYMRESDVPVVIPLTIYDALSPLVMDWALKKFLKSQRLNLSDLISIDVFELRGEDDRDSNHLRCESLQYVTSQIHELCPEAEIVPLWKINYILHNLYFK